MKAWKRSIAALSFIGMSFLSPIAQASEYIDISLNGSYLFDGGAQITNIAIANPAIADIVRPSGYDSQVLIVGLSPGSTSLFVWYADGTVENHTVNVGIDEVGQAHSIQQAIGLPRVQVQVVTTGQGRRILLKGTVRNQAEHDSALKIASLYSGDVQAKDSKDSGSGGSASSISSGSDFEYDFDYRSSRIFPNIIDMLVIENPYQIRLEAQLIEISSNDAKDIGLKYAGTDTGGGIQFTNIGRFYGGESIPKNHDTGFWPWDHFSKINASLNLLIQQGKAKVLSRPSVSTMSGAKAKIFIGGQLPVPVERDGGQTIEWKDYGIRLHIRPTVGENGAITAEVHAGVSRLDPSNSVMTSSTVVPAITAREAHSIVNLEDGSTMVVGGLLNSEDIKTVTKFPILGDIPILGEFFKHTETSTERRELIILITPIIVNEHTPARMSEKMEDYYNKEQATEKTRKDVDLNAPIELPIQAKDSSGKKKQETEYNRKLAEAQALAEKEERARKAQEAEYERKLAEIKEAAKREERARKEQEAEYERKLAEAKEAARKEELAQKAREAEYERQLAEIKAEADREAAYRKATEAERAERERKAEEAQRVAEEKRIQKAEESEQKRRAAEEDQNRRIAEERAEKEARARKSDEVAQKREAEDLNANAKRDSQNGGEQDSVTAELTARIRSVIGG